MRLVKVPGESGALLRSRSEWNTSGGQWLVERHGERGTRTWRKLHLVVDPGSGEILASELTSNEDGDASQVGPPFGQIRGPLASMTADGAYDGEPVYRAAAERKPDPPAAVVIPPRSMAVPSTAAGRTPALAFHRRRRRNLFGQLRPASATITFI